MNKISIITVTYNAAASLEATINSVIHQTYDNFEYIIIDGGSTDGTVDIIDNYREKIAYFVSEPDQGVYDAMNKALTKVTGDWVYFLGAGDVLLNVLDKIAPLLNNDYCIYYGDVYRKDLLTVYDGKFSAYKFAVNNICHQSIFYPAKVFKKYQYNLKYKIQADYALNMICFGDLEFKFDYLGIIVCLYEGEGYSDKIYDLVFFADKLRLIKANFPFVVFAYAALRRAAGRLFKTKYRKMKVTDELTA